MKKFAILITAILCMNLLSAQWIQQEEPVVSDDFKQITFVDESNGWIMGSLFSPYFTNDGGYNWQLCIEILNQTQCVEGATMFFSDIDNGWIHGHGGLWKTSNGNIGCESNWELQDENIIGESLTPIYFFDTMLGWAIEHWEISDIEWSEIYHTTNGGEDWSENQDIPGRVIRDIMFVSGNIGWAIDEETSGLSYPSGLIYTSDGGENWNSINNSIGGSSLHFTDTQNGWIIGVNENAGIWHTIDGGSTLVRQVGDTVPKLRDVIFVDEFIGWAVGNEGTILNTSNGGETWEYQESGTLADLYSISFIDQYNGWICGDNGVILHTNNGGTVGLNEISNIQSKINVFPNPSTGITTISYEFELEQQISLSIRNITGQEIKHIPLGIHKAGHYELNCADYPPGIYFITLKTGLGILTEKLIIE